MAKKKPELQKVDSPAIEKDSIEKKEIENWASKRDSDIYEKCEGFYKTIQQAYKNREEANDAIVEYWNIYNAQPDTNQQYVGNSRCYVPAVRDAINARSKRALKQLFPNKYTHVEAVGSDPQTPGPQLSLLEHYIRSTNLKSVVRSILISGDVTGQWSLYIDWKRNYKTITDFVKRNPVLETIDGETLEMEDPTDLEESEDTMEVLEEGPEIVDVATEDLVVIPPTASSVEKADITCIKLRMSKDQVQKMMDEGIFEIDLENKGELSTWMSNRKGQEKVNPQKARTSDAGVKTEGTFKYALIYEAHVRLEFEKGKKELAYVYYAGENEIIGIIKAPQWGQKRPILSAPVDRLSGSFNGVSKIEAVKFLQWNLNDFWNMGQDSAMYSLLPVVMTDPEKNPNYAMMVFGLAAVWPVDPNSTKFQSFPQLWKDSVQMCGAIEARIHQSLESNEAMMGKQQGKKNAQAVGAQMQEQSVAIVDHAERFEEEILNPLMERFFEYDCQFREDDVSILNIGELGVKATVQSIPPNQWGQRYFFQWTGTSFVMNMQRMQQQIATMNVLRGIPPQQLNGRRLDITPILDTMVENVFGPELGNQILIDDRNKFTIDPDIENEMMVNHILTEVHEADDDAEHIQKHAQAGQMTGDSTGMVRAHIQKHMEQLQKKRQMAQPQQPPQGQPGVPGGAAPGVAGTPRMGAQPQMPRPGQQPPGAIHPDAMPGGVPRG